LDRGSGKEDLHMEDERNEGEESGMSPEKSNLRKKKRYFQKKKKVGLNVPERVHPWGRERLRGGNGGRVPVTL